jgi:hypothetical protein
MQSRNKHLCARLLYSERHYIFELLIFLNCILKVCNLCSKRKGLLRRAEFSGVLSEFSLIRSFYFLRLLLHISLFPLLERQHSISGLFVCL